MQNKLFSVALHLKLLISACLLSSFLISGCSFPGVYRINVQQGNIVTQEMLDQLRPGMTRRQVHFVLGNPVLSNVFDQKTETYLYSYQKAGGETYSQKIVVYYEDELYTRYEGSVLDEQPAY